MLAGLVLVSAAAVELSADGVLALLGLALLGAGLGGWISVYEHVMCKAEPANLSLIVPWMIRGLIVVPGLGALHLVFGMTVWVILIVALMAWAVRTAMQPV